MPKRFLDFYITEEEKNFKSLADKPLQKFITRINAGCRSNGISYSVFISQLTKLNVKINRKMLSQLAIFEPKAFAQLVKMAKP